MTPAPIVALFASLMLLPLVAAPTFAQDIDWHRGETVDCPVAISTPGQERIRVVEFPCAKVTNDALPRPNMPEITVQRKANQVLIRLTAEAFDTTLNVWDENNNLYTLLVRAPGDGELPDDQLILHKSAQDLGGGNAAAAGAVAFNQDTDKAMTDLMAQMVSGVVDPKVRWSNLNTAERGQLKPGRVEFADDNLRITILRVYRSPTLYGYETLYEWAGDQQISLNFQQLWRPGILAASATDQPVLSRKHPNLVIQARHSVKIYYVCDAEVR